MQDKYNALKAQVLKWANEYYVDNAPSVTDAVFDEAFRELQRMEEVDPALISSDSPTQKVLGSASPMFVQVKHEFPMLSLYTETDHTSLGASNFDMRVRKQLATTDEIEYYAEPKYDGLAISIVYLQGMLTRAVTRGDGETGEDVTHTVRLIKNVPHYARMHGGPIPDYLEVRGEVMMRRDAFSDVNASRVTRGMKPYVNPRNAAAGAVRRQVPDQYDIDALMFAAYDLRVKGVYEDESTYTSKLSALQQYGFTIQSEGRICKTVDELATYHQVMGIRRDSLPYEIDGVVYKVNDGKLQKQLGWLSREPRWAVAHKYPPEEAATRLLAIDVQVGRTGKLTPVARLEPIFVGGVEVANSTLSNFFEIRRKKIQPGDVVIIRRAGDVIPEITGPKFKQGKFEDRFKIPWACPECGGPVGRPKGEMNYYCLCPTTCSAQAKQRFLHFAGRKALDIDGMGESMVDTLLANKLVNFFSDIYRLREEELIKAGIGPKIASNLLMAIEVSKITTMERLLYGLGIRHVGENTSRILAANFKGPQEIITAEYETLKALTDIGPIVAKSIVEYFSSEANIFLFLNLCDNLTITRPQKVAASNLLEGKSFVITGALVDHSRETYEEFLKSHGATVHGSVNKETNYLVVGLNPSSGKVAKATKLGVETISQDSVTAMLAMELGLDNEDTTKVEE